MKKRLYLWGLLLVWTPWLPTLIGLVIVFRGISSEKATGIAVLAGGLYELFLTIGVISTVVFQIVAIVLFARSFESGHWLRNAFSAISNLLQRVHALSCFVVHPAGLDQSSPWTIENALLCPTAFPRINTAEIRYTK
jgi:uncharacterized membrane protein